MKHAWQWLGRLALLGALSAAPGALAQKVTLVAAPPVAFQFSDITSRERADIFVDGGSLVKIYLFPTQLGGEDDPRNIAYVTPEAAEKHAAITGKIRRMLHGASPLELEVRPEYQGASIVPARIRFFARGSRGGAPLREVIEIW